MIPPFLLDHDNADTTTLSELVSLPRIIAYQQSRGSTTLLQARASMSWWDKQTSFGDTILHPRESQMMLQRTLVEEVRTTIL